MIPSSKLNAKLLFERAATLPLASAKAGMPSAIQAPQRSCAKTFFAIFSFLLAACHEQRGQALMRPPPSIEVKVGEHGTAFSSRYPALTNIDRQPAGLDFYEIHWNTSAAGTVNLKHGEHSFAVPEALAFTGTQDADIPEEGLSELRINAGFSNTDLIEHDQAKIILFKFLQKIRAAGWKIIVPRTVPRLRGRDMLNYLLRSKNYTTLDTSYVPTLDEWMRIPTHTMWEFYANHVFLSVWFMRESTLNEVNKPGAYLLCVELKNEAEYFRGYINPHNRKQWKELLMNEITKLASKRANAEAILRASGTRIDETYSDPPLPESLLK